MSVYHEAQRIISEQLEYELRQFVEQAQRERELKPEGKGIVRRAQRVKWEARRLARIAYAIEVLESCDPHYPNS